MDINALTNEATVLLRKLIEIPRISREEKAAADMLEQQMKDWGLTVNRKGCNLWTCSARNEKGRPTLLLNAHIDTVKATTAWTRNPYQACLEGETLYGLGANDDGASLVSLLQVFRLLSQNEQPYNLIFLASAEEEVSGKGGISMVLSDLPPIDAALVGEPTGMQPAIAEKGLMVVDVTAHGRAGHAARNEGDNAIYHAIDDMLWFRNYKFPKESALLGPVKMSVTIVQAGTQHNVIPAECNFTVDVRSNECYSNQDVFEIIKENIHGEAKARSFQLNSSRINPQHPLVRRAVELGRTPFGSPTLSDQALMPFPSMKMGPGQSSRSHSADEFIIISEIREAITLYYQLLNGLSIAQD